VALRRLFVLASTILGCGDPSSQVAPDSPESLCATIVGGFPDDMNSAVAALVGADGELYCTGTLVGSADSRSLVLTAAHCLDWPITGVIFGERYTNPQTHAAVESVRVHPDFDELSGDFDFAILVLDELVVGVQPLPFAGSRGTGDDLELGTPLVFIGYGETEHDLENSRRNAVSGTVLSLTDASFSYGQDEGGPCYGDSGGPALALLRGELAVVGVTSHGDGGCWSSGVSGRVSAAADFIGELLKQDFGCPRNSP